jgi:hypothetical protein
MTARTRLLTAALLVLGTAACSDSGGSATGSAPPSTASPPATAAPSAGTLPSAVPTPSGSAPAPGGAAAPACVTGRWRATGVTSVGGLGAATGRLTGGTGATMNVGPDGLTEVGFTGSRPLDFSAQAAGATVKGQIQYSGTLRAAVQFGRQGSDGTGKWQPRENTGRNDLRATVKLSEPVSVTLLDNATINSLTGDTLGRAGDALDVQPILRGGTYRCTDGTLRVRTQQNGPDITWTFARG